MFLSKNKINNVHSCKPQFYYINVEFKGVKINRNVFGMGCPFSCDSYWRIVRRHGSAGRSESLFGAHVRRYVSRCRLVHLLSFVCFTNITFVLQITNIGHRILFCNVAFCFANHMTITHKNSFCILRVIINLREHNLSSK